MALFKRAIITGGTGSIGMALIEHLLKKNIDVMVLIKRNSVRIKRLPYHPLLKIVECDLNEMMEFKFIYRESYDIFYNLAWDGTYGEMRNDMYLQNKNIQYTLNAVNLAKKLGCHTFIGAGSQAEYGRVEGIITPLTPTFPENGYGIAKLCAGQMSRILCHQLGLKHIWTRILSVYGPYDNENTMVMSTIKKLINGEVPKLTKGEQIWDYLYSDDAANALYLLGKCGNDGKVYCLGSGKARPLFEFIHEIRNIVNPNSNIELGAIPYNENQVMNLQTDINDLKTDVGFLPIVDFSEGIKKIIKNYYVNIE